MIRTAELGDLPALTDMAERFHAMSPYREMPVRREHLARTILAMMGGGMSEVLVCEDVGLRGMLGLAAQRTMFDHKVEVVQEAFWWCEGGDAQALRAAGEGWAKERGAVVFSMACLEDDRAEVMTRLYRRAGYRPTERHFLKAL